MPSDTEKYTNDRNHYAAFILFFVISFFSAVVAIMDWSVHGMLWDLAIYERAVNDYQSGANPYRIDAGLLFVYHPYVLGSFSLIDSLVPLSVSLKILYALSTSYFFTELYRLTHRRFPEVDRNRLAAQFTSLTLGTAGYGGAGIVSFMAGNLTAFIHLALIAVLMSYMRQKYMASLVLFVVTVGLVSFIKPYFLAYLIVLPVFFSPRRSLLVSASVVLIVATVWLSAAYLMPSQYRAFLLALHHQTLGKGDLGYSVFGLIRSYTSGQLAMLAHSFLAIVTVCACYFYIPKVMRINAEDEAPRVFALLFAAILANPRMKEYDFFPAVICAFFFAFFCYRERAFLFLLLGVGVSSVFFLSRSVEKLGAYVPKAFFAAQHLQLLGLGLIALAMFLYEVCRSRSKPASIY